jgi:hypothetical protein
MGKRPGDIKVPSWMKRACVILCSCFVSCLLLVLISPADALPEAGTSYMRLSIGCNVNYCFSPFRQTNRDLKKREYHEITGSSPQFGIELARYKYDAAWNAKRSLSFMYVYWQDKSGDGDYYTKVRLHEFSAKVRVYLLRHLVISPFLGCGVGFQIGTLKAKSPSLLLSDGAEYINTGGVMTLMTGIEWQSKPKGGILRLEGGYRYLLPKSDEHSGSIRMDTSCWFLGAMVGIKMSI